MFELIHLIGRIIIMPTRTKDETQFFKSIQIECKYPSKIKFPGENLFTLSLYDIFLLYQIQS